MCVCALVDREASYYYDYYKNHYINIIIFVRVSNNNNNNTIKTLQVIKGNTINESIGRRKQTKSGTTPQYMTHFVNQS